VGRNIAASVRERLLNIAKTQNVPFQQILMRFALERILYRMSQSKYADRFLLKGALLFSLWYDTPHRATRDADLLGFGASDLDTVAQTFRDITAVAVDDGIVFNPASVTANEIRKQANYGGVCVGITAELDRARCVTKIDIGFGDAVTPGPEDVVYPVLLPDLPAPRIRAYPMYTVVAEKLHAIVELGMSNSRMKDFLTCLYSWNVKPWTWICWQRQSKLLLNDGTEPCLLICQLALLISLRSIHRVRQCGGVFSRKINLRRLRWMLLWNDCACPWNLYCTVVWNMTPMNSRKTTSHQTRTPVRRPEPTEVIQAPYRCSKLSLAARRPLRIAPSSVAG